MMCHPPWLPRSQRPTYLKLLHKAENNSGNELLSYDITVKFKLLCIWVWVELEIDIPFKCATTTFATSTDENFIWPLLKFIFLVLRYKAIGQRHQIAKIAKRNNQKYSHNLYIKADM